MRTVILSALLLAGCASTPSAPTPTPANPGQAAPAFTTLDATTWKIQVEPLSPDEKPYADLMHFEDRHVATAFLQKVRAFAPGAYSLDTPPNGILVFEASMENPSGETLSLSGKATPELIWGTMTWRRADWSLKTYRFRGTPKAS